MVKTILSKELRYNGGINGTIEYEICDIQYE